MNTIEIKLKSKEDLFIAPDYNPFDHNSRFQSGIDELVIQFRELSRKEPVKLIFTLPSPSDSAEIDLELKNALDRYCSVKIRECELAINELQIQGKRDLVWALSLSLIFLLGAFFTSFLNGLPEVIVYLLASGLGILAWVVLWPPLDSILYEWRPCRRSQRIYKHIQSAELEINSVQRAPNFN